MRPAHEPGDALQRVTAGWLPKFCLIVRNVPLLREGNDASIWDRRLKSPVTAMRLTDIAMRSG